MAIAGIYEVNVRYKVDIASLKKVETGLKKIVSKYSIIQLTFKSNIKSVKKNIKALNKPINIPVNYTRGSQSGLTNNQRGGSSGGSGGGSGGGRSGSGMGAGYSHGIAAVGGSLAARAMAGGTLMAMNPLLGVGAGTLLAGSKAAKQSIDFETKMVDMKALLMSRGQDTPEYLNGLEESIRKIGTSSKYTAIQAADAAIMLLRNNRSFEEITKGGLLKATVDTSIAMDSDAKTTADLLTDVMAFFGKDGVTSTFAADKIVAAADTSKYGFSDMRQAIAKSGTQASMYGLKLEELTAMLSMTSGAFSHGRTGGTSLAWLLNGVMGKSDKARALMKDLEFDPRTEDGKKLKSGRELIKELVKVFKPMTKPQRLLMFRQLFDKEAHASIFKLIEGGVAGYDKYTADQAKISAEKKAHVKSNEGVQAQWDLLKSALTELSLTIFNNDVKDAMSSFLGVISSGVNSLSSTLGETNPEKSDFAAFIKTTKELYRLTGESGKSVGGSLGESITGAYNKYEPDWLKDVIKGTKAVYNLSTLLYKPSDNQDNKSVMGKIWGYVKNINPEVYKYKPTLEGKTSMSIAPYTLSNNKQLTEKPNKKDSPTVINKIYINGELYENGVRIHDGNRNSSHFELNGWYDQHRVIANAGIVT